MGIVILVCAAAIMVAALAICDGGRDDEEWFDEDGK